MNYEMKNRLFRKLFDCSRIYSKIKSGARFIHECNRDVYRALKDGVRKRIDEVKYSFSAPNIPGEVSMSRWERIKTWLKSPQGILTIENIIYDALVVLNPYNIAYWFEPNLPEYLKERGSFLIYFNPAFFPISHLVSPAKEGGSRLKEKDYIAGQYFSVGGENSTEVLLTNMAANLPVYLAWLWINLAPHVWSKIKGRLIKYGREKG